MIKVYYAKDHVCIAGNYCDPNLHKHLMKHLLISLEDEIECVIEEQHFYCRGIIISSQINHTIINKGKKMLLFLIDDSTNVSMLMKKNYLNGRSYSILKENQIFDVKNIWVNSQLENYNGNKIKELYMDTYVKILGIFNLDSDYGCVTDTRIKTVLAILHDREEIEKDILKELSDIVCLSQSRMSHLFKTEVGISLNSFLVLMKLSKAYRYLFNGESVTESCIKAGFNSSSHFANVNKKYFGMTISYERKFPIKYIEI